jgi:hypothetical protein
LDNDAANFLLATPPDQLNLRSTIATAACLWVCTFGEIIEKSAMRHFRNSARTVSCDAVDARRRWATAATRPAKQALIRSTHLPISDSRSRTNRCLLVARSCGWRLFAFAPLLEGKQTLGELPENDDYGPKHTFA